MGFPASMVMESCALKIGFCYCPASIQAERQLLRLWSIVFKNPPFRILGLDDLHAANRHPHDIHRLPSAFRHDIAARHLLGAFERAIPRDHWSQSDTKAFTRLIANLLGLAAYYPPVYKYYYITKFFTSKKHNLRYRIISAFRPRMASNNSFEPYPAASKNSILFDGLIGIFTATRMIPADAFRIKKRQESLVERQIFLV